MLKGFPSSAQAIRGALGTAPRTWRSDATLENPARAHADEGQQSYGLPRRVATDADALRLATAPETLSTMAPERKSSSARTTTFCYERSARRAAPAEED